MTQTGLPTVGQRDAAGFLVQPPIFKPTPHTSAVKSGSTVESGTLLPENTPAGSVARAENSESIDITKSEYARRIRRLDSTDNTRSYEIEEVDAKNTSLRSKLLGRMELDQRVENELAQAIEQFIFTGTYDRYANDPNGWRQAVLANKSGDANIGESIEHDDFVRWTSNGLRVPRLATLLQRHINFNHVKSVRVFVANTGGFILSHRDYIEFKYGFSRIHLPVTTANGAVTVEENTAFWMRRGEVWFLESKVPHTAGNFAPTARYHIAIDCDPNVPLNALFDRALTPASLVALIKRKPLPLQLDQLADRVAPIMTPLNVRSLLNVLTETLFVHELGAAEVHHVLRRSAEISGDKTVIDKTADLRELLIGADQA